MRVISLLTVVLFLIAGCCNGPHPSASTRPATPAKQPGKPNLTIYSLTGEVLATGDFQLPNPIPTAVKSFDGTWHLLSHTEAFPETAVRSGAYQADFDGVPGEIFIDLNVGTADHNVCLEGKVEGDKFVGTCGKTTIGGIQPIGTFVVQPLR